MYNILKFIPGISRFPGRKDYYTHFHSKLLWPFTRCEQGFWVIQIFQKLTVMLSQANQKGFSEFSAHTMCFLSLLQNGSPTHLIATKTSRTVKVHLSKFRSKHKISGSANTIKSNFANATFMKQNLLLAYFESWNDDHKIGWSQHQGRPGMGLIGIWNLPFGFTQHCANVQWYHILFVALKC